MYLSLSFYRNIYFFWKTAGWFDWAWCRTFSTSIFFFFFLPRVFRFSFYLFVSWLGNDDYHLAACCCAIIHGRETVLPISTCPSYETPPPPLYRSSARHIRQLLMALLCSNVENNMVGCRLTLFFPKKKIPNKRKENIRDFPFLFKLVDIDAGEME